jgi:hypothetical protein
VDERTEAEFLAILKAAGPGAVQVVPTATAKSVIEARAANWSSNRTLGTGDRTS